jgi:hypothetical protein
MLRRGTVGKEQQPGGSEGAVVRQISERQGGKHSDHRRARRRWIAHHGQPKRRDEVVVASHLEGSVTIVGVGIDANLIVKELLDEGAQSRS